jgi:hypothetical protein
MKHRISLLLKLVARIVYARLFLCVIHLNMNLLRPPARLIEAVARYQSVRQRSTYRHHLRQLQIKFARILLIVRFNNIRLSWPLSPVIGNAKTVAYVPLGSM